MFKNKALTCMLALGLTVAAAPAVLAGPNDTAGNSAVTDKTENPDDAPTQPPGEESAGTTTEGSTDTSTSTEGTSTEGSTDTSTSTEGSETSGPTGVVEGTEGESGTTTDTSTSTEGTTTDTSTSTDGSTTDTSASTDGSTSLPQTGVAASLAIPVILGAGIGGTYLYKNRR